MGPKEKKDAAIKRQQEIITLARSEERDLTADEKREFDELQETIETCTRALQTFENHRTQNKGDDIPDDNQRAVDEERTRVSEIVALCRQFEIDETEYIKNGTSVDLVRQAVLIKLSNEQMPIGSSRGLDGVNIIVDGEDKFRRAMTDALLMRGGIQLQNPAEGARDLRGMSLRDLAIETLKGKVPNATRMSSSELFDNIVRDYNPSSAFNAIMDQTINKAYVEGYETAVTTFEAFTTEGSLSDFKTSRHEYVAGPAGEFKKVNENGELHADRPSDALKPTRKLETYGKQFTMTRQAFINDDIGYLTTIPARYAAASRSTINKEVYKVLLKNPTIFDGVELFKDAHKNVVTVSGNIGGPTAAAIQAMLVGLSTQKNQFGEAINLQPESIVLPVGYGFAVSSVFESATINTAGNTQAANPLYKYRNQIQIVEDATINALAAELKLDTVPWFLTAAKAQNAGIQVDYLNGQKIPTIKRYEKPGVLGFVWDIFLDWGISVVDYRGLIKNPGEELNIKL